MKSVRLLVLLAVSVPAAASATDLSLKLGRYSAKPPVSAARSASVAASSSAASSTSSSRGGAALGVGSQGQSVSIDSHAVYRAQERNPVSTAVAPALMTSNDTCMGSTSVGATAVSFGLSVGSTWIDTNCLMLKNAREMWNMGFKGAALARLCMDDLNKEALEAAGLTCPARRDKVADSRSGQDESSDFYRY